MYACKNSLHNHALNEYLDSVPSKVLLDDMSSRDIVYFAVDDRGKRSVLVRTKLTL